MPGYTENNIVVLRDFDFVFDLTNRVELWTQLFTEYREAEVISREGDDVVFRLTTFAEGERPSRSWTSKRRIDKKNRRADAERMPPCFPFQSMSIRWLYEPLPQGAGTIMTWIQEFEVHPECPFTPEKMESFLNATSRTQMKSVKARVEAWQGK